MGKPIIILIILLVAILGLASCSKIRLVNKFFMDPCSGDGPSQEGDFAIKHPALDLEEYYDSILNFRPEFQLSKAGLIQYEGEDFPIYTIEKTRLAGKLRLLVIAGVHGNERASLLAVPRVLSQISESELESFAWNVMFITPANPVGAAFTSRYNAKGCDINRDFGEFDTEEARVIRAVVEDYEPDLVLATHEGPQDGFFMIATAPTNSKFALNVIQAVERSGIALANKSFLGLNLNRSGLSHENIVVAKLKRWIGLGSLGTYLEIQGIGTLTTESSWDSVNFEERINSHVITIMSVLRS